jgi:hypothetical protein
MTVTRDKKKKEEGLFIWEKNLDTIHTAKKYCRAHYISTRRLSEITAYIVCGCGWN